MTQDTEVRRTIRKCIKEFKEFKENTKKQLNEINEKSVRKINTPKNTNKRLMKNDNNNLRLEEGIQSGDRNIEEDSSRNEDLIEKPNNPTSHLKGKHFKENESSRR